MRYQVKWTCPKTGEVRYGIYQDPKSKFSGYADIYSKGTVPKDSVIVEDAILPEYHVVKESLLTDIQFDPPDEYYTFVSKSEAQAHATSDALPDGVHVGAMFQIGVGDGYATYVVTKVNKKTCKVEWRGFCLDRWMDHHFGMGGTFPISEIARYCKKSMFSHRV